MRTRSRSRVHQPDAERGDGAGNLRDVQCHLTETVRLRVGSPVQVRVGHALEHAPSGVCLLFENMASGSAYFSVA